MRRRILSPADAMISRERTSQPKRPETLPASSCAPELCPRRMSPETSSAAANAEPTKKAARKAAGQCANDFLHQGSAARRLSSAQDPALEPGGRLPVGDRAQHAVDRGLELVWIVCAHLEISWKAPRGRRRRARGSSQAPRGREVCRSSPWRATRRASGRSRRRGCPRNGRGPAGCAGGPAACRGPPRPRRAARSAVDAPRRRCRAPRTRRRGRPRPRSRRRTPRRTPALAVALEVVEREVGRHGLQPAARGRAGREHLEVLVGLDEDLLGYVLRLGVVPHETRRGGKDHVLIFTHEGREVCRRA